MRMSVVAEGTETPTQLDLVSRVGCTHAQRFRLWQPVPAEQLGALLMESRRWTGQQLLRSPRTGVGRAAAHHRAGRAVGRLRSRVSQRLRLPGGGGVASPAARLRGRRRGGSSESPTMCRGLPTPYIPPSSSTGTSFSVTAPPPVP